MSDQVANCSQRGSSTYAPCAGPWLGGGTRKRCSEKGANLRGGRIWHHRAEGDVVCTRVEAGAESSSEEDWFVGPQVPPSIVKSVLGGDFRFMNCHWTHCTVPSMHSPMVLESGSQTTLLTVFSWAKSLPWGVRNVGECQDGLDQRCETSSPGYNLGRGGEMSTERTIEGFTGIRVPDFAGQISL